MAGLWLGGGWLHWLDVFATTDPRLDIVLLEKTEATIKHIRLVTGFLTQA